jgi:hypothetical protein
MLLWQNAHKDMHFSSLFIAAHCFPLPVRLAVYQLTGAVSCSWIIKQYSLPKNWRRLKPVFVLLSILSIKSVHKGIEVAYHKRQIHVHIELYSSRTWRLNIVNTKTLSLDPDSVPPSKHISRRFILILSCHFLLVHPSCHLPVNLPPEFYMHFFTLNYSHISSIS